MIYVSNKIYAKVWKVTVAEKYIDLRISTSVKDENDNYKNSGWFPRAIGKAMEKLKDVKEGDRITINKAMLTNERYTDDNGNTKSAFKFLILDAEIQDDAATSKRPDIEQIDDTGLPF